MAARGWRIKSWNGPQILDAMKSAEVSALEETTQACVSHVQGMRSGRAAAVEAEGAQTTSTGASVRWGLFPEPQGDPFWELFVEAGGPGHPGDNAKRRAADQEYPRLAGRIRTNRGE